MEKGDNMKILNPIGITNIGDPFVIIFKDTYYLYATSFIDGFLCWKSKDLIHWEDPVQVYKKNGKSFGYKDFWAPEVIYHNGHFVMHYTARWEKNSSLRIGVAIADNPLGPFIDVNDKEPMFDDGYAVIDGHVFIDDDGERYFYYDRDCSEHIKNNKHESHIYVTKLDSTLTKIVGQKKMVLKPEQPWEIATGTWRWNEGPFLIKNDNRYYLMYSGGFYASKSYAIGYAVADHPTGPFVKADENPILSSVENKISGPGHNSVIKGLDGKTYCIYHVHTHYHKPSGDRQVFIDEIKFIEGKLIINGPTLDENNQ
jgi:beta-xylosidase